MAFKCQHCGAEIDDDRAFNDVLDDGSEVVKHRYSNPGDFGTVTDLYCDLQCAAAEVSA